MNLKDREVGGTNKMGEEFKTVYKELPVQNVGKAFRYGDYDIKQDDKFNLNLTSVAWNLLNTQTRASEGDVVHILAFKDKGKWVYDIVLSDETDKLKDVAVGSDEADPFPTDEEGKTADEGTIKNDYSTAEDDKWDKINAKRRREIAWGQAFNLSFNHAPVGNDLKIPMDDIIKNAEAIFPELLRDDEELQKLLPFDDGIRDKKNEEDGDAVPF